MKVAQCVLAAAVMLGLIGSLAFDGWARAYLFPNFSLSSVPPMHGKVAVVTGPTLNGIGHISARELARAGAHVVLAGRSAPKGHETIAAIRAEIPSASLEFLQLDLSSLSAVREAAAELLRRHRELHVLMLNAGVMACPFELSADGLEMQFATNHLGHFLLTYLLTDVMSKSAPSRVVVVSSAASFIPEMLGPKAALNFSTKADVDKRSAPQYGPWAAYGRSKFANVLFAQELASRFGPASGVHVLALHPGGIRTNLARHIPATGGEGLALAFQLLASPLMMSPEQGAVTQLFAATSPQVVEQNMSGAYLHPQARLTKPTKLATASNRAALWALSMQLTAPQRAWFTPHSVKW
ncbi:hypothetical protein KFE25_008487 [Diacronema lutheri]|uniref:Protochlorophyllide reductase n=1 Tax=Diacronema lutheri TaxID=2081491 RepID=A0A8J5XJ34_DIALT|nr:hypothetical protein KFE25_008487 [Diacronema lutheri]